MGIIVNKNAKIKHGKLAGMEGKVIAFNFYDSDAVTITIDEYCEVTTHYDNVEQDGKDD